VKVTNGITASFRIRDERCRHIVEIDKKCHIFRFLSSKEDSSILLGEEHGVKFLVRLKKEEN